jgi:hypothetical protein
MASLAGTNEYSILILMSVMLPQSTADTTAKVEFFASLKQEPHN